MNVTDSNFLNPCDVPMNPKSGRPNEFVFIPKKVADRLKDYIRVKQIEHH